MTEWPVRAAPLDTSADSSGNLIGLSTEEGVRSVVQQPLVASDSTSPAGSQPADCLSILPHSIVVSLQFLRGCQLDSLPRRLCQVEAGALTRKQPRRVGQEQHGNDEEGKGGEEVEEATGAVVVEQSVLELLSLADPNKVRSHVHSFVKAP